MKNSGIERARQSWAGMKQRCLNPRSAQYHNYGGRGISICERWADSFANFLADMGERPVRPGGRCPGHDRTHEAVATGRGALKPSRPEACGE